jgi:selenocysteine-specific elongation factor
VGALATRLGRAPDQLRAALIGADRLGIAQGVVFDPERARRASDTDEGRSLVAVLDASPFSPPAPADPALARALVRDGTLVDVDGIVFSADAIARARSALRPALAGGGSVSVSDVRELLGSSRKYVVPLLEHFDREGFTRRRDDVRVAGPRLDQL